MPDPFPSGTPHDPDADEAFVWTFRAADLAYRRTAESMPERAAPLWPALLDDEFHRSVSPYPDGVRELSARVSDTAQAFIEGLSAAITHALAEAFRAPLDASEKQLRILEDLLADAGVEHPTLARMDAFVWSDCGESMALALLDDLVCAPDRQLLTAKSWAASTRASLDEEGFLAATGLAEHELQPMLDRSAVAALEMICTATESDHDQAAARILRYRDRWVRLRSFRFGEFVAAEIEVLQPLLAVSHDRTRAGAPTVIPFAPSDAYDSSDGLRLVLWPGEKRVADVTLALEPATLQQVVTTNEGILLLPVDADPTVVGLRTETVQYGDIALVLQHFDVPDTSFRITPSLVSDHERAAQVDASGPSHGVVLTYLVEDVPGVLAALVEQFDRSDRFSIVAATEATAGGRATLAFLLSSSEAVTEAEISEIAAGEDVKHLVNDKWLATLAPPGQGVEARDAGSCWSVSITGPTRNDLLLGVAAVVTHYDGLIRRVNGAPISDDGQVSQVVATVALPAGSNVDAMRQSLNTLFPHPYEVRVTWAESVMQHWFDVPEPSPNLKETAVLVVHTDADAPRLQQVCEKIHRDGFSIVDASASVLGHSLSAVFALSHDGEQGVQDLLKDTSLWLQATYGVSAAHFPPVGRVTESGRRTQRYDLRFDALDRIGVLAEPLHALAELGCNVESVYAEVLDRVSPPAKAIRLTFDLGEGTTSETLEDAIHAIDGRRKWLGHTLGLVSSGSCEG